MSLSPGDRLGVYEIHSLLGAGGMGEVYRATDTRLKRQVALKVLPTSVTTDAERLARFQREAEVLAALNHPNIAAIYGVDDSGGTPALVMELVEGPTLADRIADGAIPLHEALPIARQIAEALEAAHEQGIIHRDLKPANIKVRPDGTVKVLDFGLAKALAAPSVLRVPAAGLTDSPTLTSPALVTANGVLLGTAAYMAPEQARGKPADKRSDIWAFGCVLFEMLTGHRAFDGPSVGDVIAAVIYTTPDWSALAPGTPPAIRTLLRRCLQKDRQQRLPDIGLVRIEVQDATSAEQRDEFLPKGRAPRRVERLGWTLAVVTAAVAGVLAPRPWVREPNLPTVMYRSSMLPVPEAPMFGLAPGRLAVSPDGRQLAFPAASLSAPLALWLRSLEHGTARRLPGTEGGTAPFWSPDSRSIAFIAQGRLKKIDIDGGPPMILAEVSGVTSGGSWSRSGVIVFPTRTNGPLFQVLATGGEPTAATTLDTGEGDDRHWWPYFLPDGRHFLYEAIGSRSSKDDPRAVYVGSLDPAEASRILLHGGSNAKYADGHVLFMRERTLMAQQLDEQRLVLTGEPLRVAENIEVGGVTGQSGAFSVSENGVLIYQAATAEVGGQLGWFDRGGRQIRRLTERARYFEVELSPDSTRAAVTLPQGARTTVRDLWIVDLLRGVKSPFTPGERSESAAVWSPDGARVAFSGGQPGPGGSMNLFTKSSTGASAEHTLIQDLSNKAPSSWSRDGRFLLYSSRVFDSDSNLWVLPLTAGATPIPYMQTTFNEMGARFSPDGRWVAFSSDESGRFEIYIAPFPETGRKWPVSTDGGAMGSARWRSDGRELFFITGEFMLTAAAIDTSRPQPTIGDHTPLFRLPNASLPGTVDHVAADGRFLLNVDDESGASASLSLVINWTNGLARR